MKYKANAHAATIRKWLKSSPKSKSAKALSWLKSKGHDEHGIGHLLNGAAFTKERKEFLIEFHIR